MFSLVLLLLLLSFLLCYYNVVAVVIGGGVGGGGDGGVAIVLIVLVMMSIILFSSLSSSLNTGAIQLKNWKPLSFDVITDDKDATIDDILRELKEYTLRIRLSRSVCVGTLGGDEVILNTLEQFVCLLVACLLNVPATCECISGTDVLRQFYMLPH